MKKLVTPLALLISLSSLAQTADEVIQKLNANMGGLEAFNKITTAKMTGYYSVQGQDFPLSLQVINGKAMRTDVQVAGQQVINCYNNGKGWKVNPYAGATKPVVVTGSELSDLKIQSYLSNQLMDHKERGHQVELLGQEAVEGISCFKIKLTNNNDGRITYYFIAATDYSLIKSVTEKELQGTKMDVETWFSDLKETGGVKIYMRRDTKIDGQIIQTIKLEKVELDVAIDNKIFEIPE